MIGEFTVLSENLLDLPLRLPLIFRVFDSRRVGRSVDGDWWFDWLVGWFFLCIVCGDSGEGRDRYRQIEKKERNEDHKPKSEIISDYYSLILIAKILIENRSLFFPVLSFVTILWEMLTLIITIVIKKKKI